MLNPKLSGIIQILFISRRPLTMVLVLPPNNGCPTFSLPWATMNEEELSWAAYEIYKKSDVYK